MKTPYVATSVLLTAVLMAIRPAQASAQIITSDAPLQSARADSGVLAARPAPASALPPEPPVLIRERDLSGPRIGVTMATSGSERRAFEDRGLGQVVSQFGWHFEHQVVPLGGGPQLITEVIPLFGGVEYGKIIPSFTFAIGIRTESGMEFGMGPSFTLVNASGHSAMGLVVAAGKSIDYAGISIPVDLAVSTNPQGTRTTLTAGYAIRRASR